MRYTVENPFVQHECLRLGLEKAPIPTNMYESYAQCNEDIVVETILRALTRRAGRDMRSVRYIEIGANHPVQTSATYLLNRVYGASGVLVEANPRLIDSLTKCRPNDIVLNCAITASHMERVDIFVHEKNELSSMSVEHINRFQSFGGAEKIVEKVSIDAMEINTFLKKFFGDRVDFLSIDVEGFDLQLVSAMDPVFQPLIIQCEHEQQFDQFNAVLGKKGYNLCAITDVNVIYTKSGIT
jgi:FkbM family methyltransferase